MPHAIRKHVVQSRAQERNPNGKHELTTARKKSSPVQQNKATSLLLTLYQDQGQSTMSPKNRVHINQSSQSTTRSALDLRRGKTVPQKNPPPTGSTFSLEIRHMLRLDV